MILSHPSTLQPRYISPGRSGRPVPARPPRTRNRPSGIRASFPRWSGPADRPYPAPARLQPLEPPSRPPPFRLRPSALHTLGIRPTGPRPIRWHSSRPSAPPAVPCPTRPSGPRPTDRLPVGPPGSRRSGLRPPDRHRSDIRPHACVLPPRHPVGPRPAREIPCLRPPHQSSRELPRGLPHARPTRPLGAGRIWPLAVPGFPPLAPALPALPID